MAKVNGYNRVVCARLLTAGFLHVEAMKASLWLDEYSSGLTPSELKHLDMIRQALHDVGEDLRQMGGVVRASLKQ